jgi:hypothetical protein
LEQDIRDTTEWWFYWNFRATYSSDYTRNIVFEFSNGEVLGPWGPAVSTDGIQWKWLGQDALISRASFQYSFTAGGGSVYFAFSLPYQLHHFERFYTSIAAHPCVRRQILIESEQLRSVPLLLIGNSAATKHIVMTSRHHSCESTPSYLLEGLLNYYLTQQNSPVLENYLIHYVPFIDIDGVENGDQGKSRSPHDHNRDYIELPLYKSTAAVMEYVKALNPIAGIDFHGPFKWGGRNDKAFFVKQVPPVKQEIESLSKHLQRITSERSTVNAIRHRTIDDIDMGVEWNQPVDSNCSSFFVRNGSKLACTFEFSYFGDEDTVYTVESCRQFGVDFACALEVYLFDQYISGDS